MLPFMETPDEEQRQTEKTWGNTGKITWNKRWLLINIDTLSFREKEWWWHSMDQAQKNETMATEAPQMEKKEGK